MERSLAAAALLLAAPLVAQDRPPDPLAKREPVFRTLMEGRTHGLAEEFEDFGAGFDAAGVTSDACSLPDALRRARAWLQGNGAAEAVAALKGAGKSVSELGGIAGAAAAKGKLALAVAALLEVVEREPANAAALANLAAALAPLGLCAEAVAIAEAAEPLAEGKTGAMGLPLRCIALNARGYALLRQGKAAEAAKPLKEAVALGGALASDAARNLALALKRAKEDEESKKVFLMACWRRAVEKPVCYGGKKPKQGDPAPGPYDKSVSTFAPVRLLFDLSQGKAGKLPTFGHPQTIGAARAFPKLLQRDSAPLQADAARSAGVKRPGGRSLEDRRARNIVHLLNMLHHDPDLQPSYAAMEKGGDELRKKTQELHASCIQRALEIVKAGGTPEAVKQKLSAATLEAIGVANGYANAYDTLVRKYWDAARRLKSGLAANIKSPAWHDYALSEIRLDRVGVWGKLVVPLQGVYAAALSGGWAEEKEAALPPPGEGGEEEDGPGCPSGLEGVGVEFSAGPLSISMSCESVGVELSSEGPLKGFISLETSWSGEMTVYAGAKLELDGKGILPGISVHDGIYISGDRNGVTDAGFRVGFEGYKEMGGMKVKATLDQMNFSLMPRAP